MRKVFIGLNHDGKPTSIVIASNIESARAYWQGKDLLPHSEKIIDLSDKSASEEMGYVTPILETKEISCRQVDSRSDCKLLTVK